VRELQSWIDRNVRFDAREPDPMLFPETAEEIARAQKFVPVTFSNYIPPEARDGKTFGPRSWKRADGNVGSKTCELSTTGVVMVGPHRGEAFAVCVAKEKCTVHWGAEIRERKKRAAQAPAGSPGAKAAAAPPKQDDPKLREALATAFDQATDELRRRLGDAAAEMKSDAFIRAIACLHSPWDMLSALERLGEKVNVRGIAGVERWVRDAHLAKVQKAIAYCETERNDWPSVCARFGIDAQAIEKDFEKRAREAYKAAQTSAQPTKPKTAAKGAKKKGGSK